MYLISPICTFPFLLNFQKEITFKVFSEPSRLTPRFKDCNFEGYSFAINLNLRGLHIIISSVNLEGLEDFHFHHPLNC